VSNIHSQDYRRNKVYKIHSGSHNIYSVNMNDAIKSQHSLANTSRAELPLPEIANDPLNPYVFMVTAYIVHKTFLLYKIGIFKLHDGQNYRNF
jgi:hypothetical protein